MVVKENDPAKVTEPLLTSHSPDSVKSSVHHASESILFDSPTPFSDHPQILTEASAVSQPCQSPDSGTGMSNALTAPQ